MRRTTGAIAILLTMSAVASAQTRTKADTPSTPDEAPNVSLSPGDAARVERLISQLGSNNYEEREAATEQLSSIGLAALEPLRSAFLASDDLEVRLRIEDIVFSAYLMINVYDQYGFLGISQRQVTATNLDDKRIPAGHVGIVIRSVTKNTGAERAGLQEGDVIIGLDGEPIKENFRATAAFGQMIRDHAPGDTVALTILRRAPRRSQQLTLQATLTRCPKYLVRGGRIAEIPEQLQLAKQQFPAWWAKHIRNTTSTSGD